MDFFTQYSTYIFVLIALWLFLEFRARAAKKAKKAAKKAKK